MGRRALSTGSAARPHANPSHGARDKPTTERSWGARTPSVPWLLPRAAPAIRHGLSQSRLERLLHAILAMPLARVASRVARVAARVTARVAARVSRVPARVAARVAARVTAARVVTI